MAIREGKWRCPNCKTVSFARHMSCTGCGAQRGEVEFFLDDDAPEVTDAAQLAEAKAGADWICAFCQQSNRAKAGTCDACGAPRDAGASRSSGEVIREGFKSLSEQQRADRPTATASPTPSPSTTPTGAPADPVEAAASAAAQALGGAVAGIVGAVTGATIPTQPPPTTSPFATPPTTSPFATPGGPRWGPSSGPTSAAAAYAAGHAMGGPARGLFGLFAKGTLGCFGLVETVLSLCCLFGFFAWSGKRPAVYTVAGHS